MGLFQERREAEVFFPFGRGRWFWWEEEEIE
jgi:hypothetical protein